MLNTAVAIASNTVTHIQSTSSTRNVLCHFVMTLSRSYAVNHIICSAHEMSVVMRGHELNNMCLLLIFNIYIRG